MNEQELKDALAALSTKLEGKSKDEVKSAIESFESKHKESVQGEFKSLFDAEIKGIQEDLEAKLKAVQEHADKLDVKLQEKSKEEAKSTRDMVKDMIVKNFSKIAEVSRKGKVSIFEEKAVGNMTLATNLVGDQPRTFSDEVAIVPNQISNFSDLISSINIGNGTYTFPREGAGEGAAATQVEGSDKAQIDTDITMVDVNTDFIAGFQVYSKKMANNLPFLESFLPGQLRRKYFDAENSVFNTALAAAATASAQIITGKNTAEMLINEIATLAASNYNANAIVLGPADYHNLLKIEKSTGSGYGLPIGFTFDGGVLRCLGIPLYQVNWLAANKYYVGDWSTIKKVTTEGLAIEFSTSDEDNFRKNNITARVEAQVGLAIHRTDAVIYGDFTAI